MRRSLTLKLMLAFLLVSLLGVILVAVFFRVVTQREFDRFNLEQAQSNFTDDVTTYYQIYGSWRGVAQALRQPDQSPPLAQPGNQPPLPRQPEGNPPPLLAIPQPIRLKKPG